MGILSLYKKSFFLKRATINSPETRGIQHLESRRLGLTNQNQSLGYKAGYTVIHCHSDNSIKDSPLKVKDLVARAKEVGATAVTLTDHGTCTGNIEFLNECKKQGIRGIPGVEAYVETPWAPHAHLVLLPINLQGYQDICCAVSDANANLVNIGGVKSPVMTMNTLRQYCSDGNVLALSACVNGVLASVLLHNDTVNRKIAKLEKKAQKYNNASDDNYNALLKAEQELDQNIADMTAHKQDVVRIASKSYAKRLKGLRAYQNMPDYSEVKTQLDKEIAETEQAKKENAQLKKELTALRKQRSANHTQVVKFKNDHDKYQRLMKEVEEWKDQLHTPTELEHETEVMLQEFLSIFSPSNFVIELQNHGLEMEHYVMPILAKLAKKYHLHVVATNDAHIATPDQAPARQFMKALRFSRWDDISDADKELYIKDETALYRAMLDIVDEPTAKAAMQGERQIGRMCHVELPRTPHYPKYRDASGTVVSNAKELLRQKAEEGIQKRFPNGGFDEAHRERMNYELSVIDELGYNDYLLIVADFINYGKNYAIQDNPYHVGYGIGPGRGSGAGCLVNYLLGITNLDPLKYGLIFERFLNKERVSMPDIDTDLSAEVREPTIEYVKQKYGKESVACIRTSITQGAKGAIRNSARLRGFELYGPQAESTNKQGMNAMRRLGDNLTKYLPDPCKQSLKELRSDILSHFPDDEDAELIYDRASEVENTITGTSIHAAGVIIGDGTPLKEIVPLLYNDSKQQWAVQCDMVEAEHDLKLLKMDFLGLKNLDIITECVRRIKQETGETIDLDNLPMEQKVFQDIFSAGNTSSVFQFESAGMKKMLKRFQPSCFEDIILLVAAYRPGPMQFIPDIIDVKHGVKKPHYVVPELEPILASTYGQPIYQEQLMDIFHKCAGFTLGEADIIRRHMSKKHVKEFMSYQPQFVHGVMECGASEEDAKQLWDSLEGFASYGFNKSHAAAYAYVSYQTAYLKYHYPVEYMCAVLNHAKTDKVPELLHECHNMGIKILPPDVNNSSLDFTPCGDSILYGLNVVKTFDKKSCEVILTEKEANGQYHSFYDFLTRTQLGTGAVTKLVQCGALDGFHRKRCEMLMLLEPALSLISKIKKKEKQLQELKDTPMPSTADKRTKLQRRITNAKSTLTNLQEKLQHLTTDGTEQENKREELDTEYALLGAYISGHPLDEFEFMYTYKDIYTISQFTPDATMKFVGMITNLRVTQRKKDGAPMAFFDLEDKTGVLPVCAFVNAFEKFHDLFFDGNVIEVEGKCHEEIDQRTQETSNSLFLSYASICHAQKAPYIVFMDADADLNSIMTVLQAYQNDNGTHVYLYDENASHKNAFRLVGLNLFVTDGVEEIQTDAMHCTIQKAPFKEKIMLSA